MCLKKVNQKETRFSHIAMCINASETPFFISIILCFYVLKIIKPNRLNLEINRYRKSKGAP